MSEYEQFCAVGFGQALAEVAIEDFDAQLTPELIDRARAKWNITPSAFDAVLAQAREILGERKTQTK